MSRTTRVTTGTAGRAAGTRTRVESTRRAKPRGGARGGFKDKKILYINH